MEVYFWQRPRSKKTHGGLQAVTAVTAGQSQAAVVSATFLSTADNSDMSNLYVDNVSLGDQVKVVIAMDNGGSTLINQTWNASDVLSVTFEFNNGAHKTVFDPNGGNGFSTDFGSFVTDGSGQLMEVPSDWTDDSNVNAISTNSRQTPNAWYLNPVNDKYFTNDGSFSVGIPDAASNTDASNWTISFDSSGAVPEPSSLAVFGIGMCVAGVRAARRRRLDPKQ
jgi:hypothetical protein